MLRRRRAILGALVAVVSVGVVVACVGDDPDVRDPDPDAAPSTPEAGRDAGAEAEALDAGLDHDPEPFCDPGLPFGAPEVVLELSAEGAIGDFTARLSPDGLVVYFSRVLVGGNFVLHRARRSSRRDAFGPAEELKGIGHVPAEYDSHPFPLADGTGFFFQRSTDGGLGRDVLIVSANADGTFGTPVPVLGLSTPERLERSPYLWRDEMWIDVHAPAADRRLARARAVRMPDWYTAPEPLDAGAGAGENDQEPVLSADGLTLYFASTRDAGADDGSAGGADIWMMHRSVVDAGFGPAERMAKLTTPAEESPSWISPDDCELYLHRIVDGKFRILRATRR